MSVLLPAACTHLQPAENVTLAPFCFACTALPIISKPSMLHHQPADVGTHHARAHQHPKTALVGVCRVSQGRRRPARSRSLISLRQIRCSMARALRATRRLHINTAATLACQVRMAGCSGALAACLCSSSSGILLFSHLRHLSMVVIPQHSLGTAVHFAQHSTDASAPAVCFAQHCRQTPSQYSALLFPFAQQKGHTMIEPYGPCCSALFGCSGDHWVLLLTFTQLCTNTPAVVQRCCSLSPSNVLTLQPSFSAGFVTSIQYCSDTSPQVPHAHPWAVPGPLKSAVMTIMHHVRRLDM